MDAKFTKILRVHGSALNHFNAVRHLYGRSNFKLVHAAALAEWRGFCAFRQERLVAEETRLVRIDLTAPVNDVAAMMNNHPGKSLWWATPAKAMAEKIAAFEPNDALAT
ncbi:MAG: hypothetical protein ACJAZ1_002784 [Yoonia sp.]|jgi:hypothetical protein